jgi:EthD domain
VITRFGLAPRLNGLDIEDFQIHWRGVHGPLVAKLRGLRRNWQCHAVLQEGKPLLAWAGFDACSEMDFDDVSGMLAAFSAEHYPRDLKSDSAYLVDMSKAGAMITERIHGEGTIDLTNARLMTFLRCAPRLRRTELETLRLVPRASSAVAREVYLSIDDCDGIVSSFDALDVQWFATPSLAQQYVVSAEAGEHRHAIAGLVRGVERLIARVHVNF